MLIIFFDDRFRQSSHIIIIIVIVIYYLCTLCDSNWQLFDLIVLRIFVLWIFFSAGDDHQ